MRYEDNVTPGPVVFDERLDLALVSVDDGITEFYQKIKAFEVYAGLAATTL